MTITRPVRFQFGEDALGLTSAVVLSDFAGSLGPALLDEMESLFARYHSVPREVVCSCGSQRSSGKYSRVRSRIRGFLNTVATGSSDTFTMELCDKSPRDVQSFYQGNVVASASRTSWQKGLWFGVDATQVVESADEYLRSVASCFFKVVGPSYGYLLNYPKQYGIGYYVASLVSVPSGRQLSEFDEYSARVTRWRDRKIQLGLRERDGYIREVFQTNLLLDAHMDAPVHGKSFHAVAEELGSLSPFPDWPGVHVWTLPSASVEYARDLLETSGLVLSSPTEPISLVRRDHAKLL